MLLSTNFKTFSQTPNWKVSPALSDLVVYCKSVKFSSFDEPNKNLDQMSSFPEGKSKKCDDFISCFFLLFVSVMSCCIVVNDTFIGAGGPGLDSRPGQIRHSSTVNGSPPLRRFFAAVLLRS